MTMNFRDLPDMSDAYAEIQEKAKKKLDAVGKEDGDVDNDGDKDKSDSYLLNRRKVISKAIKKESVEEVEEGSAYGLTKGTGKPGGAMKAFLDKRAKELEAKKKKQKPEYKNNPAFGDASHHSNKKMSEHHQKDKDGNTIPHEDELNEADKKGKGSGEKDACYKKVKASAKVWPSAYASGRLVQCRKKGAANYGNKSEEAIWEEIGSLLEELGFEGDIDITLSDSNEIVEEIEFQECWKTHKKVGMKMKGGKLVNDCRPKNEEVETEEELEEDEKMASKFYDKAKRLGRQRHNRKSGGGVGKNERAAYNLSQASTDKNKSLETQSGNQTGGGSKSYGYARNKSNPVKSKSVGDTGSIGHERKANTKITTKKDGKTPLKTPKYKYSSDQRRDMGFMGRLDKRDPKKNPKHTANTKKEDYGYAEIYADKKVEQIDEISADLALKASKKAEVERGKAAVAGNKERAIEKMKQSSRLYAKQAKKRRMEAK